MNKGKQNKKTHDDLTYKSINNNTFWMLGNFECTQIVIKSVSTIHTRILTQIYRRKKSSFKFDKVLQFQYKVYSKSIKHLLQKSNSKPATRCNDPMIWIDASI